MAASGAWARSEEHTSELQSPCNLVCRLLLEKKKKKQTRSTETKLTTRHRNNKSEPPRHVARMSSFACFIVFWFFCCLFGFFFFFFFNDTATTEIYTLSLHDALPIWMRSSMPVVSALDLIYWLHAAPSISSYESPASPGRACRCTACAR